jgi:SAM-dependent methyltransferase
MTATPLIYRSPRVYGLVMRGLYGRHYGDRYAAVASEVPASCSVLDVCAGDCLLFTRHLRGAEVRYRALDVSPEFVAHARARGIDAGVFDLTDGELPVSDVVVMQGSLYQFITGAAEVLQKLRRAARVKVVVAEPVRNLSDTPIVGALARQLTRVGRSRDHGPARFDVESLTRLFERAEGFERAYPIPGGRELVGVFGGGAR